MKFSFILFLLSCMTSNAFAGMSLPADAQSVKPGKIKVQTGEDTFGEVEGNLISFKMNGKNVSLSDDDGLATLALLHGYMVQPMHEKIYSAFGNREKFWEEHKKDKVSSWNPKVKHHYRSSLNRLEKYLSAQEVANPDEQKAKEKKVAEIKALYSSIEKSEVTFEDINGVGKFIEEHKSEHAYFTQVEGKEGSTLAIADPYNPIGGYFTGFMKGIMPSPMYSGCGHDPWDGDIDFLPEVGASQTIQKTGSKQQ
jgi:hypothetical protein